MESNINNEESQEIMPRHCMDKESYRSYMELEKIFLQSHTELKSIGEKLHNHHNYLLRELLEIKKSKKTDSQTEKNKTKGLAILSNTGSLSSPPLLLNCSVFQTGTPDDSVIVLGSKKRKSVNPRRKKMNQKPPSHKIQHLSNPDNADSLNIVQSRTMDPFTEMIGQANTDDMSITLPEKKIGLVSISSDEEINEEENKITVISKGRVPDCSLLVKKPCSLFPKACREFSIVIEKLPTTVGKRRKYSPTGRQHSSTPKKRRKYSTAPPPQAEVSLLLDEVSNKDESVSSSPLSPEIPIQDYLIAKNRTKKRHLVYSSDEEFHIVKETPPKRSRHLSMDVLGLNSSHRRLFGNGDSESNLSSDDKIKSSIFNSKDPSPASSPFHEATNVCNNQRSGRLVESPLVNKRQLKSRQTHKKEKKISRSPIIKKRVPTIKTKQTEINKDKECPLSGGFVKRSSRRLKSKVQGTTPLIMGMEKGRTLSILDSSNVDNNVSVRKRKGKQQTKQQQQQQQHDEEGESSLQVAEPKKQTRIRAKQKKQQQEMEEEKGLSMEMEVKNLSSNLEKKQTRKRKKQQQEEEWIVRDLSPIVEKKRARSVTRKRIEEDSLSPIMEVKEAAVEMKPKGNRTKEKQQHKKKESIPLQEQVSIPLLEQESVPSQEQGSIPLLEQVSIPSQEQESIPSQEQVSIPSQEQGSIPLLETRAVELVVKKKQRKMKQKQQEEKIVSSPVMETIEPTVKTKRTRRMNKNQSNEQDGKRTVVDSPQTRRMNKNQSNEQDGKRTVVDPPQTRRMNKDQSNEQDGKRTVVDSPQTRRMNKDQSNEQDGKRTVVDSPQTRRMNKNQSNEQDGKRTVVDSPQTRRMNKDQSNEQDGKRTVVDSPQTRRMNKNQYNEQDGKRTVVDSPQTRRMNRLRRLSSTESENEENIDNTVRTLPTETTPTVSESTNDHSQPHVGVNRSTQTTPKESVKYSCILTRLQTRATPTNNNTSRTTPTEHITRTSERINNRSTIINKQSNNSAQSTIQGTRGQSTRGQNTRGQPVLEQVSTLVSLSSNNDGAGLAYLSSASNSLTSNGNAIDVEWQPKNAKLKSNKMKPPPSHNNRSLRTKRGKDVSISLNNNDDERKELPTSHLEQDTTLLPSNTSRIMRNKLSITHRPSYLATRLSMLNESRLEKSIAGVKRKLLTSQLEASTLLIDNINDSTEEKKYKRRTGPRPMFDTKRFNNPVVPKRNKPTIN